MQVPNTQRLSFAQTWRSLAASAPKWFWLVLAIGLIIRVYLAVFTEGTSDIVLWQQHATGISEKGLIAYYHENALSNHPPFIGSAEALVWRLSGATNPPFRIWLRLPFVVFDLGSMSLLLVLLAQQKWRFFAAGAYWLHPLALIFSAYHGNTDSAVPFFLLLCLTLLSRENIIGAGIALGMGFWFKLPGELAIPAFLLMAQGLRNRIVFLLATAITAGSTYLPALVLDPWIVYTNVFGYRPALIFSSGGLPVWGFRVLANMIRPEGWPPALVGPLSYLIVHGWKLGIFFFFVLTWLRRSHRSALEVGATIGAGYIIVYGFTDGLTFQYFAWALPFWFFLPRWFLLPGSILAGGYIYSLYWFLCGNPWLLGKWDFVGHPLWPPVVITFRNLAMIVFLASGCWFLISAAMERIRPAPKPTQVVKTNPRSNRIRKKARRP